MAKAKKGPALPAYVKDMTGWRHPDGAATVLGPDGLSVSAYGSRQGMYWRLRCDCGAAYRARGCKLRMGRQVRCRECQKVLSAARRLIAGHYACPWKGKPHPGPCPVVACPACGADFVRRLRDAGQPVRYCSQACFNDVRAGRVKPREATG